MGSARWQAWGVRGRAEGEAAISVKSRKFAACRIKARSYADSGRRHCPSLWPSAAVARSAIVLNRAI